MSFPTTKYWEILISFSEGIFEIAFLPESQAKFDALANQTGPFTAVESTAYYESYSHVLAGMKTMREKSFPLANYIVSPSSR
mgnify:CR=1 FL=1